MKNNRLKEGIKAAGYETLEAFAKAAKVSDSSIYSYVEGRRSPKRKTAKKILKMLKSKDITLIYPDLHK